MFDCYDFFLFSFNLFLDLSIFDVNPTNNNEVISLYVQFVNICFIYVPSVII